MKGFGKMIKPTVKENTFIRTVLLMKENGKTINKMEKEKKYGQMEQSTRANIKWDLKTAMENLNGLINQVIKVILKIIIFTEKENIFGTMEENL